jgi:succinate-semialdehyde dehydrogenase/glutarate-semialdehyde dehydrogenase
MTIESRNPTTEEVIHTYKKQTSEEINAILGRSHGAFLRRRNSPIAERAVKMFAASEILKQKSDRFAELITAEMGKPIAQSMSEIRKCAQACSYYAEHAEAMLYSRPIVTDASESYVSYEPLGVILAVMPWNFPFWQVFRFAAPALMAGNAAILKHASNVSGCALAIEEIFREAGFDDGLFATILTGSDSVSKLIEDRRIVAVTLTGGEVAGRSIASAAGRNLKKCVLELGGSDPFIVLDNSEMARTAHTATLSRTINSGQSCIAAKRFIVVKSVIDEFTERLISELTALHVGDPADGATQIGPLAKKELRDTLQRQIDDSVRMGARVLLGGTIPSGRGYFYPVTLLDRVTSDMPVAREETFGPCAVIIEAKDAEEALIHANASEYGLSASVWTNNMDIAREIAMRIESGSVFINGLVKSDVKLPFGGIKGSGYGRELSTEGIREFVNIKTVWIG